MSNPVEKTARYSLNGFYHFCNENVELDIEVATILVEIQMFNNLKGKRSHDYGIHTGLYTIEIQCKQAINSFLS